MLTSKGEDELLVFIHEQRPTIREIQEHFNISSTSVADYYIDHLIGKELLAKRGNMARGVFLTEEGQARIGLKKCPTCGALSNRKLKGVHHG